MTVLKMNEGNKEIAVEKLIKLTIGRLEAAKYEIIEIDKELDGAAEIKVKSFDDYMRLLNEADVKFILLYKYSGVKEVADLGVKELEAFRLGHLVHTFRELCKEMKEKYKDSYINLYTNIGGIVTVIKLKFINKDMVDILSDMGEKIGHTFMFASTEGEKE